MYEILDLSTPIYTVICIHAQKKNRFQRNVRMKVGDNGFVLHQKSSPWVATTGH